MYTRARKNASAKRQDLAPPKNLVRNVKGKEPRASHRMVAEEASKAGSPSNVNISQSVIAALWESVAIIY